MVKPYYSDGLATIYKGDAVEVLPSVSATVAITDPPYNVGIHYGDSVSDLKDDYEGWCRSWWNLLPERSAVSCGVANVAMWCRISEPDWIYAWHKPASMGRCVAGFNNWEPVLVWGKPAVQSNDVVVAPIVPDPTIDGHPVPKPLKWATGLVGRLAAKGDVIVDPFMGSGSVVVAATQSLIRSIGIEIEERFCDMAASRLDQRPLPF